MPTESPCIRKTRRTACSVPLMGQLESRTMFSAISSSLNASIAKLESSITLPVSTNVVHIGPSRSVKTLTAAKWPGKSDKPVTFSLDPGTYSLKAQFVPGNVSIIAADPSHPPTLKLPPTFKKISSSKYLGSNPTLYVLGSLTVKNVQTTGGKLAVFLGSSSSGKIDAENINMTDGGAICAAAVEPAYCSRTSPYMARPSPT